VQHLASRCTAGYRWSRCIIASSSSWIAATVVLGMDRPKRSADDPYVWFTSFEVEPIPLDVKVILIRVPLPLLRRRHCHPPERAVEASGEWSINDQPEEVR
jgi:hypothetical protein